MREMRLQIYAEVLADFFSPHMGRTRYMKCPECGKRSWQKKVLKSEESEVEG